jgi:hypothetical protein
VTVTALMRGPPTRAGDFALPIAIHAREAPSGILCHVAFSFV